MTRLLKISHQDKRALSSFKFVFSNSKRVRGAGSIYLENRGGVLQRILWRFFFQLLSGSDGWRQSGAVLRILQRVFYSGLPMKCVEFPG